MISDDILTKHGDDWKAVALELSRENNRLRAENAKFLDALKDIVRSGYDEASRVHAAEVATRAILAKAKEQP